MGDTVVFECGYTGTSTYPKWNINGTEYRITALPQYHRYTAEGLEVHPVTLSMNNTMYSCFFSYSGEREESNSAYLFVRTSSECDCIYILTTLYDGAIASKIFYMFVTFYIHGACGDS